MFLTLLAQDAGLEKELGELKDLNTRARLSGVRLGQIHKGATQAVVG
jgi:hypothetical protein